MISFDLTKDESAAVTRIVQAVLERSDPQAQTRLEMDLAACHNGGCPLDFDRMLEYLTPGRIYNVAHDVFEISNNLDRKTGGLHGHFWPRFAKK